MVARCKFGIDLVDLDEKVVHSLCTESSTSSMHSKMAIMTSKEVGGHSIQIYFNAQMADRRALKYLTVDAKLVKNLTKEPERDYYD